MTAPPRILAIAGSDSSGGAGIQADIKTITMLGGYAMTAITAVTAQNTVGVLAVEALRPSLVLAQIEACFTDIGVDAIKIGMLGSSEIAEVVADRMVGVGVPIVFDPVMISTSGVRLADARTIESFERLIRMATLSTPNGLEAETLGGVHGWLARKVAFLVTGGDAESDEVEDALEIPGQPLRIFGAPRIYTRHTHGTGCTLSSAIATYLGFGLELTEAIDRARHFVRAALAAAPGFGAGHGPMGHHAVR